MPLDRAKRLVAFHIPDRCLTVKTSDACSCDNPTAVLNQLKRIHFARQTFERANHLLRFRLDDVHFAEPRNDNDSAVRRSGQRANRLRFNFCRADLRHVERLCDRLIAVRPEGSGFDPGFQQGDLVHVERVVVLRRHFRFRAAHHDEQPAGFQIARLDRRASFSALFQFGKGFQRQLSLPIVRVVAGRAVLSEKRCDLLRVIRRRRILGEGDA